MYELYQVSREKMIPQHTEKWSDIKVERLTLAIAGKYLGDWQLSNFGTSFLLGKPLFMWFVMKKEN